MLLKGSNEADKQITFLIIQESDMPTLILYTKVSDQVLETITLEVCVHCMSPLLEGAFTIWGVPLPGIEMESYLGNSQVTDLTLLDLLSTQTKLSAKDHRIWLFIQPGLSSIHVGEFQQDRRVDHQEDLSLGLAGKALHEALHIGAFSESSPTDIALIKCSGLLLTLRADELSHGISSPRSDPRILLPIVLHAPRVTRLVNEVDTAPPHHGQGLEPLQSLIQSSVDERSPSTSTFLILSPHHLPPLVSRGSRDNSLMRGTEGLNSSTVRRAGAIPLVIVTENMAPQRAGKSVALIILLKDTAIRAEHELDRTERNVSHSFIASNAVRNVYT